MTRRVFPLLGGLLLLGCPERSRLTGPTTGIGIGIGIGPEITITDPGQDGSMIAGSAILVKGTAFDEEGVDS